MKRILLVGLGGMGAVHYANYKLIDDCEVVAAVGQSENDRTRATEWNLPLFPTIKEACAAIDVDVVDICTPTFLHYENVKEALSLKKHVICEKPLALNAEDARALFDKARAVNRHLFVAHVVQFMPETQFLRELVADNTYGRALDASFKRLSSMPKWGAKWMFDKEKAGLIPYDLHIHDLDVIVSLFGKPDTIAFTKAQGLLEFPELFRFMYHFGSLNVVSEASWLNANIPFTVNWSVYFEKAYVTYDGSKVMVYPEEGDPIEKIFEEEVVVETGINVSATAMYFNELKHFMQCIDEDLETPYVTESQVIAVLETLESISGDY